MIFIVIQESQPGSPFHLPRTSKRTFLVKNSYHTLVKSKTLFTGLGELPVYPDLDMANNQHNKQARTALKPSCTVMYIGRLLDRSIKPHPSEGRRGCIGEERGLFPREKIERVHLETRDVDIDPML